MKKEQVYVEVESKEQAEIYRKVLESIGEQIHHDYEPDCVIHDRLVVYESKWMVGFGKEKQKITFGELIDLLQTKPLLVSEDGVELFEGDNYLTVDLNGMVIYNHGYKLDKTDNVILYSNEYKAFSTRESALEWIEAQKPNEKNVKINDDVVATVYKEGWAKFSVPIFRLSENEIKRVLNAMEELN